MERIARFFLKISKKSFEFLRTFLKSLIINLHTKTLLFTAYYSLFSVPNYYHSLNFYLWQMIFYLREYDKTLKIGFRPQSTNLDL